MLQLVDITGRPFACNRKSELDPAAIELLTGSNQAIQAFDGFDATHKQQLQWPTVVIPKNYVLKYADLPGIDAVGNQMNFIGMDTIAAHGVCHVRRDRNYSVGFSVCSWSHYLVEPSKISIVGIGRTIKDIAMGNHNYKCLAPAFQPPAGDRRGWVTMADQDERLAHRGRALHDALGFKNESQHSWRMGIASKKMKFR